MALPPQCKLTSEPLSWWASVFSQAALGDGVEPGHERGNNADRKDRDARDTHSKPPSMCASIKDAARKLFDEAGS